MRNCYSNSFTRLIRLAAIGLIAFQSLLIAEELELGMTEDQVWSVLGKARFELKRGNDTFLTFDDGIKVVLTDGLVSAAEGITLKRPVVEKATISRKEELENRAKSLAEALKPKTPIKELEASTAKKVESTKSDPSPEIAEAIAANEPGYDPAELKTESANPVEIEANNNFLIYIGAGVGAVVLGLLLLIRSKKGAQSDEEEDEEISDIEGQESEKIEASEEPNENSEEKVEPPVAVFKDPSEFPEGKTAADLPSSLQLKPKAGKKSEDLDFPAPTIAAKTTSTENSAANFPPPNFAPTPEKEEVVADSPETDLPESVASIDVPSLDELVAEAKGESVEEEEVAPVEQAPELAEASTLEAENAEEEEIDFEAALEAYISTGSLEEDQPIAEETEPELRSEPISEAPAETEVESAKPRLSLKSSKAAPDALSEIEKSVEEVKAAAEELLAEEAAKKPKLRLDSK